MLISREETGYLINSDTTEEYTNVILKLISEKFDNKKAIKARKIAEKNFSLDNMLKNIEMQYENLFKM